MRIKSVFTLLQCMLVFYNRHTVDTAIIIIMFARGTECM